MKRKYKVEWYEYDLTEPRCCRFFTGWAATLFGYYIEKNQHTKVRINKV